MADIKQVNIEGYTFSVVDKGLDQAQVAGVITKLTAKCKLLTEMNAELKIKEEHMASLTRLAEKTVKEADLVAAEIVGEAQENARSLLDKTTGEAEVIKQQLLDQLNETSKLIIEVAKKLERPGAGFVEQAEVPVNGNGKKPVLESEDKAPDKALSYGIYDTNPNEVSLEILPPLNIDAVMRIIEKLKKLPEVENTHLLSRVDKPLLTVNLKQPLDLIKILNSCPDVKEVSEASGSGKKGQVLMVKTTAFDSECPVN